MAKKYYAVAVGKTPGIYFTWEDCKAQVDQFPGAVYKSFKTIAEAESFCGSQRQLEVGSGLNVAEGKKHEEMSGGKTPLEEDCEGQLSFENVLSADDSMIEDSPVSTDKCLISYVDGSYEHSLKRYAYGCVMVLPDELVKLNGAGDDEDYVSMRNVAGEILGSEKAILWALEHGYSEVVIYYDYEGIEKWANDIWKANKPGTIRYKQFVAEQRKNIKITFHKVAAHTGVTYNEMADQLAKAALELGVCEADS